MRAPRILYGKEEGDGHVSITINTITDIMLEPSFDKQSKEAASKILSLCEIEICLTGNYGVTLTSRYDGCTITIDDLDFGATFAKKIWTRNLSDWTTNLTRLIDRLSPG